MTLRTLLPLLGLLAWASTAAAQPAPAGFAGDYAGEGEGDLTARVDAPRAGLSRVELTTGSGGRCTGAVDGEVRFGPDGRGELSVANPDHDPQGASPWLRERHCRIAIAIEGAAMTLSEGGGCLSFHGAACAFSGSLQRR